ncbi:unnamed protein product, partial [Ectocarpus sp. 13 AM-2016]
AKEGGESAAVAAAEGESEFYVAFLPKGWRAGTAAGGRTAGGFRPMAPAADVDLQKHDVEVLHVDEEFQMALLRVVSRGGSPSPPPRHPGRTRWSFLKDVPRDLLPEGLTAAGHAEPTPPATALSEAGDTQPEVTAAAAAAAIYPKTPRVQADGDWDDDFCSGTDSDDPSAILSPTTEARMRCPVEVKTSRTGRSATANP